MNRATALVVGLVLIISISFVFVLVLSIRIISNIDTSALNIYTEEPASQMEEVLVNFTVVDVIDGDTIKVLENGEVKTVRLIGIDAPEVRSNDCKNEEATQLLSNLILNKDVQLESDPSQTDLDRYGRQLRYVFFDNENINQVIIEEGLALEYTYSKPYKYKSDFWQSQNNAKVREIGIWSEDCII